MNGFTRCPHCQTCFKIAEEQLGLRQGRVRCGQCHQAFDAREGYVSSTLANIDPMSTAQMVAESLSQIIATPAEPPVIQTEHKPRTKQRIFSWLAGLGSALLLMTLLGQGAYFFRIDLAARYPNLKPALLVYCQVLQCRVPLPQKAEWMSIESSDLEAVPEHEELVTLNALLRNRANYAQAFPYLELTLNNTQDQALARRIFRPINYLPRTENEKIGLLGNHEVVIKLPLNIRELKASGYRLVLFYPKK